jgi:hypothetical protein
VMVLSPWRCNNAPLSAGASTAAGGGHPQVDLEAVGDLPTSSIVAANRTAWARSSEQGIVMP